MKNIVHIPVLKSENRSVNYTNHTAVCTGHTVISTNHTVTLTFLTHKDRLSCRHPQVLAAISLVLSKEKSQKHTQQDNKQKAIINRYPQAVGLIGKIRLWTCHLTYPDGSVIIFTGMNQHHKEARKYAYIIQKHNTFHSDLKF